MALPCIDDSCNIKAEINPETRHLILTALTSPGGGILPCTVDGGLGINVLGSDVPEAAPPATAFMDLGITNGDALTSELWAALKGASVQQFGGGINDAQPDPILVARIIPHDGTESLKASNNTNPISDGTVTNPFAAPALCIVHGTFRLGWSLAENGANTFLIANNNGSIDYIPYHAKIRAQIIAKLGAAPADWEVAQAPGGGAAAQSTAFFDVGGMARNDKAPQHLRDWRDFVFSIIVPANTDMHLAASGTHHGDYTIRTFVDTETFPAVGGAEYSFDDRGIRCSGRAIFLPLTGAVS